MEWVSIYKPTKLVAAEGVMPVGFASLGRVLILMGLFLIMFGLLVIFWGRLPLLGKLPGDIVVQKGNFRFFFPVVTSVVLSLIITLVANIVLRALGRYR